MRFSYLKDLFYYFLHRSSAIAMIDQVNYMLNLLIIKFSFNAFRVVEERGKDITLQ
jgi:hypothetical protein